MPHYFRYPAGSTAYSLTLTLPPAFVTIQEENIRPVQRVVETDDGTLWAFQVSGNRRQTYRVSVEYLSATGTTTYGGYTQLKAFFNTSSTAGPNYMINSFDLFHDDSSTVPIEVRLVSPEWTFEERKIGRFSGRFDLAKVL